MIGARKALLQKMQVASVGCIATAPPRFSVAMPNVLKKSQRLYDDDDVALRRMRSDSESVVVGWRHHQHGWESPQWQQTFGSNTANDTDSRFVNG